MSNKSVLIAAMMVSLFVSVVYGQPWAGSGDVNDPYQIWTAADMQAIGATPYYWGAHFRLCSDIDLSAYTGTSYNIIGTEILEEPRFIAIDSAGGKMYWTDSGIDKIQRANLDGSEMEDLILGLTSTRGIAIDSTGGKMYWANSGPDKIQRANLDGSGMEDLVTGLSAPYGITLDATNSKMYWTDISTNKIQRANLDGTGVEDLVTTGLADPYGIALDVAGGKMYWTEAYYNKICRANLDGTAVEDLVTGLVNPYGIALNIAEGKMYWTDYSTNKIQRANLDGTAVEDLVTGLGNPYGIALDTADGKMYWIDGETNKIQRAVLDGTEVYDVMVRGFFTGVFDGNGHTISNFTYSFTYDRAGLFGYVDSNDAIIKDLGLINPYIYLYEGGSGASLVGRLINGKVTRCYAKNAFVRGDCDVGALVGRNAQGIISHCYATGDVKYSGYTGYNMGGLVGGNENIITDCNADVSVEGDNTNSAGGLVGLNWGSISYCFASGDIFTRSYSCGGLVGRNAGEIYNCHVSSSDVQTFDDSCVYVGGLAGLNEGKIEDCSSTTRVAGIRLIGGFVGLNRSGSSVSNCHASGPVFGTSLIGGLAGANSDGASIADCSATGDVSGAGSFSSSGGFGGLAGKNSGDIWRSFSTGYVRGFDVGRGWWTGDYAGGLIGLTGGGTVSDCYSRGHVEGEDCIGGLVGKNNNGDISNCYSTGTLSGVSSVGGLIGYDDDGDYSACFWDSNVNPDVNGIGNGSAPEVMGLSTAAMQLMSTYTDAGWDFIGELENGPSDEWTQPSGGGYPIFWWQLDEGELPPLVFSGGSGDANEPYLISTGMELNMIGHNGRLMGSYFKLIADIDLSGITFFPIGSKGCPFGGVFDGDGHMVSNLVCDRNGVNYTGLFGYINGSNAEVKNLSLIDPNVNGGDGSYVGALVGGLRQGSVNNSYVNGGSVTGNSHIGGLTGIISEYGSILNCYSTGNVTGQGTYVGGLVGWNSESNIANCYSTGTVMGDESVGGLAGYNDWGDMQGSYSTASVSGNSRVGGLLGLNYAGYIQDCYSTGSVTGGYSVGGLVGYDYGGDYTASFWDTETSGRVSSAGGGTGLPTVLMQTESTFTDAGWDFVGETVNGTEDIWKMNCEGMSYPKLSWWEPALGDFICPDGVNMLDFAILGDAWFSDPNMANWDPACDISEPNDNVIDALDLDVFTDNYLTGL